MFEEKMYKTAGSESVSYSLKTRIVRKYFNSKNELSIENLQEVASSGRHTSLTDQSNPDGQIKIKDSNGVSIASHREPYILNLIPGSTVIDIAQDEDIVLGNNFYLIVVEPYLDFMSPKEISAQYTDVRRFVIVRENQVLEITPNMSYLSKVTTEHVNYYAFEIHGELKNGGLKTSG